MGSNGGIYDGRAQGECSGMCCEESVLGMVGLGWFFGGVLLVGEEIVCFGFSAGWFVLIFVLACCIYALDCWSDYLD